MHESTPKGQTSKLVYIHELDSVRNSPLEISFAQKRLYEEVLINGNTPVISFNQLTDSRAFLSLIADTVVNESEENVDNVDLSDIGYLMMRGRIRIVRFNDVRTASQYLQDNLDPERIRNASGFVLSGWPIPSNVDDDERSYIYATIRDSLRNCDPDYIASRFALRACGLGANEVKEIKQLVIFMLSISKTRFAYADINGNPKPSFLALLDHMIVRSKVGAIGGLSGSEANPLPALPDACRTLESIRASLRSGLNSRSSWYNALRSSSSATGESISPSTALAYQMVDLCYNMTVEAGIDECSLFLDPSHEEAFDEAVGSRLARYAADYQAHQHRYDEGVALDSSGGSYGRRPDGIPGLPDGSDDKASLAIHTKRDWNLLVHIQQALDRRSKDSCERKRKSIGPATYGYGMQSQQRAWRRNVYRSLGSQMWGAVVYVLLFGFIEVVLSVIDELMESTATSVIAVEAAEVSDLFTFDRALLITAVFILGVLLYAALTPKGRPSSLRIPLIGIGAFFFVLFPLITCIDLVPGHDGALKVDFQQESLGDNFLLVFPSILVGFIGVIAFALIGSLLENRTGLPGLFDSMKLLKSSLVDIFRFRSLTRAYMQDPSSCTSPARDIPEGAGSQAIPSDAWSWLMDEQTNVPAARSDQRAQASSDAHVHDWDGYLDLVKRRGDDARGDSELQLVLDPVEASDFARTHRRDIGIIHDSPYNTLVVDVVRSAGGDTLRTFAYERLIPKASGAAVIIPLFKGAFIMLEQYRHALSDYQICFPRGFGEEGLSAAANAAKELHEEIGADRETPMHYLGDITPDSGISSNRVSVFWCEVDDYDQESHEEGIAKIREVDPAELKTMIENREITDGFTLAALMMYETQPR